MKRTNKRAIIALDLDSYDAPGLVSFTRGIGKGLTGNVNFTAADLAKLPVALANLLTAATTLETTYTSRPTTPSKAATKLQSDQANTLMDALTDIGAFVEGLANTKAAGDLATAEAIILSVGFQLKKTGVRAAKGFGAVSQVKGALQIHVPAVGRTDVKMVRYSLDSGATYSLPIIVHGVELTITGLKSGTNVLVEMATSAPPAKKTKLTIVAGTEAQAWSDPVTCVVS